MARSRRRTAVASAVAAGIALPMIMWSAPASADPGMENMSADEALAAKVDPDVLNEVADNGDSTFWVHLDSKADLSAAKAATGKVDKGTAVYEALTEHAKDSQSEVRALLDDADVEYQSYWIVNTLKVTGDADALTDLALRTEVDTITPDSMVAFDKPLESTEDVPNVDDVAWGVDNINAPQAWDEFGAKGDDVVVANLDTGVDFDHPALVEKYRGNNGDGTFSHDYNFYDPAGLCGSTVPCDTHGHGSHTMGTMVGSEASQTVGVAPNAKWIAAVGCAPSGCPEDALLGGAQWFIAPTDMDGQNPDPSLAPDVVNNSWGSTTDDPWFEDVIDAWTEAGIFSSWSNGNEGEAGCESSGSPGIYPQSYSSGAYDVNDEIAYFSSRGPGRDGEVKPNISAPGVNVMSAKPGGGYQGMSGTSMAAPHTAGVVAQMWSVAPALRGDVTGTRDILSATARNKADDQCGGTEDNNNVYGEGRLDAYAAVAASPMGDTGALAGSVTSGGSALNGARISVTSGDLTRETTTGSDGGYHFAVLPTGAFNVTASKFGYISQTVTVDVTDGGSATADFDLEAAPSGDVSGVISDGSGHGWPLYAKVSVDSTEVSTYTDPETGAYALDLPAGDYSLTVDPVYGGYDTVTDEVSTGSVLDFQVPVGADCTAAPGYEFDRSQMPLYETFDSTSTPEGWDIVDRGVQPWSFDDPESRGNKTGGSGGYAIADSDHAGSGSVLVDTDLVSPEFDLSTSPSKVLSFASDYYHLSNSKASVELTVDGGTTWTEVWAATSSKRGPTTVEVDLSAYADATAVQVKFHYNDNRNWAWWWQVDNVQIGTPVCQPVDGGLVIGNVMDSNTGGAINDATVTDTASGANAKTAATPDDENVADGFFWMFTDETGAHDFSATRKGWSTDTQSVDVVDDSVARAGFTLGAGRLVLESSSVSGNVTLGGSWTEDVDMTNTGNAPVNVEVAERNGGFTPMSGPQSVDAKLTEKASPDRFTGDVDAVTSVAEADSEWTQLANLPQAVFDTASAYADGVSYTLGGIGASGASKKAYKYDVEAGEWGTIADMPEALMQARAAVVDGKLYVFNGWASSTTSAKTYIYDPESDSWTTGASSPAGRAAMGIGVVNGAVYIVGGCANSASCDATSTAWRYDPAGDSWESVAEYPSAFSHGACGGVNDELICAGGTNDDEDLATTWAYDDGSDSWERRADMPRPLWGMASAAANGMLVVSNGVVENSSALTSETSGYDAGTDQWVALPASGSELYRGSMSCGIVKAGGRSLSNAATADAEMLGGYNECGSSAADVPWLSSDTSTVTIDPGETKTIEVTMSATTEAGIDQPGEYSAGLVLDTDTPYGKQTLGVTMTVAPTASMGKAAITVDAYASCTTDAVPMAGAQVQLRAGDGTRYDLSSDGDGNMTYWLKKGSYTVIVSKDGWAAQSGVLKIKAGRTNTASFTLDKLGCQAVKVDGGWIPVS